MDEIRRAYPTDQEIIQRHQKHDQEVERRERRKAEQEAAAASLKASWARVRGEEAVSHLLKFLCMRYGMVSDLARDGMGIDPEDGKQVRLTSEQRVSQLDRLAGIQEAITYLENHLSEEDLPSAEAE